jgi:hypothetical protein
LSIPIKFGERLCDECLQVSRAQGAGIVFMNGAKRALRSIDGPPKHKVSEFAVTG